MFSRQALLPTIVLSLAACATAQGANKPASNEPAPGLSDQELDSRRANLDVKLAARAGKVKQGLDKIAAYQLKAEKERLDFERYIAEERKAFYLFLKSVRADERQKELERFTDKQDNEREEFDKKQLSDQKDWFRETVEKPWKSESLELEAGSIPAAKVPAPADKEPAAEPKSKPAPVHHKAVYKKKTKPAVKKKPVEEVEAPAPAPTPQEPVNNPVPVPAPPAPSGSMGSPDAPAPPPPGN